MKGNKLDKKFYGQIRKVKDGTIVPDDQYVVFLVKDDAFATILPAYLDACADLGCDEKQLELVRQMIADVDEWRALHLDQLKKPDAAGEKVLP